MSHMCARLTRQIIIKEDNDDDDDVEEDKMRRLVVVEPTLWIGSSLRGYGERGDWGPQSAHRCQLVLFFYVVSFIFFNNFFCMVKFCCHVFFLCFLLFVSLLMMLLLLKWICTFVVVAGSKCVNWQQQNIKCIVAVLCVCVCMAQRSVKIGTNTHIETKRPVAYQRLPPVPPRSISVSNTMLCPRLLYF